MTETPTPDPELNEAQKARVSELSIEELSLIDNHLLSHASVHGRKVAMLVGLSIMDLRECIPSIPDIFYAQRIRKLVAEGHLLSEGDLRCMRFSEVRLP